MDNELKLLQSYSSGTKQMVESVKFSTNKRTSSLGFDNQPSPIHYHSYDLAFNVPYSTVLYAGYTTLLNSKNLELLAKQEDQALKAALE